MPAETSNVTVRPSARMLALRWHGRRDLRLDILDTPIPAAGQVLVAVERVGICGTDMEEYVDGPVAIPVGDIAWHGISAPLALGHEIVGTVAACPGGEWALGTRVIPDVVRGCGTCWWCIRHEEGLCPDLVVLGLQAPGGLAGYLLADAATCVAVPDELSPDVAVFAEPLAVAIRALNKVGHLQGRSVAVVGSGVIGALVIQVARHRGADLVAAVDPVEARRSLAFGVGATTFTPDEAESGIRQRTEGRGCDVVVECAGSQAAVRSACQLVRPGGDIVLVGMGPDVLELSLRRLILAEVRLHGSAAHLWDIDVDEAVGMLAAGDIDVSTLLSAVVPLRNAVADAFERLVDDRSAVKIVIDCEAGALDDH